MDFLKYSARDRPICWCTCISRLLLRSAAVSFIAPSLSSNGSTSVVAILSGSVGAPPLGRGPGRRNTSSVSVQVPGYCDDPLPFRPRTVGFDSEPATTISGPPVASSGGPAVGRRSFFFLASAVACAHPACASPPAPVPVTGPSSPENKPPSARQEFITGSITGVAVSMVKTFVKYPLDTAAVRLQMPQLAGTRRSLGALFADPYDGVFGPLLGGIPSGAVFFAVKDGVRSYLSSNGASRVLATSLAVGIAQLPYWLIRNPTEVVKTRLQAEGGGGDEAAAYLAAAKGLAAGEGSDLYAGYWDNNLYAYPADVIKFVAYDAFVLRRGGKGRVGPVESAVAGAASTAIAQLVTTPLDVVRNRAMAVGDGESSYFGRLRTIAAEEGAAGLFSGAAPRVGKAVLSGAIQFATYEETKARMASILFNGGGGGATNRN